MTRSRAPETALTSTYAHGVEAVRPGRSAPVTHRATVEIAQSTNIRPMSAPVIRGRPPLVIGQVLHSSRGAGW